MRHRLATLVCAGLLLSGCGGGADEPQTAPPGGGDRLSVVATTAILADFATVIGGDRVEVRDLIKAGVDPHDYEPTPADLARLSDADIIVRNGVGLEEWFEDTIAASDTDALIVDASTGVELRRSEESGEPDPHIWHSPVNAKVMVSNIRRALEQADPEGKTGFEAAERAYHAQLDALRGDIRRLFAGLPNKTIVTNHDSIGYFIDEFGLTYVGAVLPSFDSQAELSSAQIVELVSKIKAHNVKAVFAEATVPPDTAATLAREAGVKVVAGDDAIYGDSLGSPGGSADTYLKMERHNANVIFTNLR